MATLDSPEFWQPYLPQLRREFSELTMDILIAGGGAGAAAVPGGSMLVDWDVFNEDALAWLDMYLGGGSIPGLTVDGAYPWAWSLNESTRRGVAREIDRWVRNGDPLPELELRLRPFFDDTRARRVAVTEVTRIYASGNVMAWRSSGVVDGKRWMTAVDERVCPVCSKLHNKFVELNRGWEFSDAALAARPDLKQALGAPVTVVVPPAHVNCILPGNEVVIPGRLSAATQSFYDGRAIEITVRSGRVLTVTENHPILTPGGYIAAKFLCEGGYVIRALDSDGIATAVNPDNNHIPTAIEKVFSAFKETHGVVAGRMPVTAEDFHGDGRGVYGNVDIVYIDRFLQNGREAALSEHFGQYLFGGDGMALRSFPPFGRFNLPGIRNGHTTNCVMCGTDLLLPFLLRHERPLERLGFGTATDRHIRSEQASAYGPAIHTSSVGNGLLGFTGKVSGDDIAIAQNNTITGSVFIDTGRAQYSDDDLVGHALLGRQFIDRFTGLVAPDEIVSIREFNFRGHVYDLQVDDYELYITDDIITSNCRCWIQPVVFAALTDDELSKGQFDPTGGGG